MGKSTISMAIFNSYVSHYQRDFTSIFTSSHDQETCITERTCDQYTASKAFDGIKMPGYILCLGAMLQGDVWGNVVFFV